MSAGTILGAVGLDPVSIAMSAFMPFIIGFFQKTPNLLENFSDTIQVRTAILQGTKKIIINPTTGLYRLVGNPSGIPQTKVLPADSPEDYWTRLFEFNIFIEYVDDNGNQLPNSPMTAKILNAADYKKLTNKADRIKFVQQFLINLLSVGSFSENANQIAHLWSQLNEVLYYADEDGLKITDIFTAKQIQAIADFKTEKDQNFDLGSILAKMQSTLIVSNSISSLTNSKNLNLFIVGGVALFLLILVVR